MPNPARRRIYNLFLIIILIAAAVKIGITLWPSLRGLPSEYLTREVPAPRMDSRHPCVYFSMMDSSPAPKIGQCGMSSLFFSSAVDQFEVDLRYGNFVLRQTDLFLQDEFAIPFTRTYNSRDWVDPNRVHAFGEYANQTYDIAPLGERNPYAWQMIALEDGDFVYLDRISKGTDFADAVFQHSETAGLFYKAITYWNGDGWTTRLGDGSKILFPESYAAQKIADGAPDSIIDAEGHKLELRRDAGRNLRQIHTPNDHKITLSYNDRGFISRAEDDQGHWVEYLYNAGAMVVSATSSSGKARHYEYDGGNLTRIRDEHDHILLQNAYRNGVLVSQQFSDGEIYQYQYRWSANNHYVQTALILLPDKTVKTIQVGGAVPEYVKRMR